MLDIKAVQVALERVISMEDYDVHKFIKHGEDEDDIDRYPELTEQFITYYEKALNDNS